MHVDLRQEEHAFAFAKGRKRRRQAGISVRTLSRWSYCSRVSSVEQASHLLEVRLAVLDQQSHRQAAEERTRDLMTIVALWAAMVFGKQVEAAHKRIQAGRRTLRITMGQAKRTSKLLLDLRKRKGGGANTGKRAYLDETAHVLTQARAFYIEFFLAHAQKFKETVVYY